MILPYVVDAIIILALALAAYDGYRRGFIALTSEVIAVLLGFGVALWLTPYISPYLVRFLAIPVPIERPLSFFLLWMFLQVLANILLNHLYNKIPSKTVHSTINRSTGTIPSVLKGTITIAVILTLMLVLPISAKVKEAITNSKLANPLTNAVRLAEQHFLGEYANQVDDSLAYLSNSPFFPRPETKGESVHLNFVTTKVSVDTVNEIALLKKVNEERRKVGLNELKADSRLRDVARAHARDMFARGYFAHESPDGVNPFERLSGAGIVYLTAGENLAMAPTVEQAHIGLMNSPKHKENILYPQFGKIGIGVIDGGIYGKMFVQEFSN